jgi:hypothetical protein
MIKQQVSDENTKGELRGLSRVPGAGCGGTTEYFPSSHSDRR